MFARFVFLSFLCLSSSLAFAGKNALLTAEEQQQITSFLMHKRVRAKVDMNMTQDGFIMWWNDKKQEWITPSLVNDVRRYGLGVKQSQIYEITRVKIREHDLLIALGDGGLVTKQMVFEDEHENSAIRQQVRQTQYAKLQAIAKGSSIGLYFHNYQFPPGASKLDLIKELLQTAIDLNTPDEQQSSSEAGKNSAEKTSVEISCTQLNADIEIDGVFAGNTPSTLLLSNGTHLVEVKKAGFKKLSRSLLVQGGTVRVNAELEKAE